MTSERSKLYGDVPTADSQDELSPAKFVAIGLLLAGRPYADVAREVGIDTTMLHRWRREPAFASELRSQFELIRESTIFGLFSLAAESITALRATLKSQNEIARVTAAQTVLDRLGIQQYAPRAEDVVASRSTEIEERVRAVLRNEFQGVDEEQALRRVRSLLDNGTKE